MLPAGLNLPVSIVFGTVMETGEYEKSPREFNFLLSFSLRSQRALRARLNTCL
jgi:hypothetical protein